MLDVSIVPLMPYAGFSFSPGNGHLQPVTTDDEA